MIFLFQKIVILAVIAVSIAIGINIYKIYAAIEYDI
jgi:hypothetical protein